jgi:selenoprotein W-related protein
MPSPRLEIAYCPQCQWLLRSAWVAQELLTTFQGALGEVALVPSSGGVWVVRLDGEVLFDRKAQGGGFPEVRALKQMIRDRIAPEMSLGHSDRPARDP